MSNTRRTLIAAYWLAGIIAGGHASGGLYDDARADGRTAEDAALIASVMGIGAAAGWPLYAAAKMWGRWA